MSINSMYYGTGYSCTAAKITVPVDAVRDIRARLLLLRIVLTAAVLLLLYPGTSALSRGPYLLLPPVIVFRQKLFLPRPPRRIKTKKKSNLIPPQFRVLSPTNDRSYLLLRGCPSMRQRVNLAVGSPKTRAYVYTTCNINMYRLSSGAW